MFDVLDRPVQSAGVLSSRARREVLAVTNRRDADAWRRGLLAYGAEERLLRPVQLYRDARDAGISDRSAMTSAELAAALASTRPAV